MMRVQQGSRAAFDALVERYDRRLIAFFYRQCADTEVAEDCTQEVFIRLYRARARYGPQASFATFLFTIARNYWIDVVRSRRARPKMSSLSGEDEQGSEDASNMVISDEPGPPARVENAEEVRRLMAALDHLPSGQREVVLLGVIEALPYADVAKVLGIPVGTVKSRVHAAVHTLRALLVPTPPSTPTKSSSG
jgi:RNA polymerase sigma-70 factor (ECF subfamily)